MGNTIKAKGISFPIKVEPAYLTWDRPRGRTGYNVDALLDEEGYDFLLNWQNDRCAMCSSDKHSLVLDHCHESGLVRGLLCSSCNTTEPRSPRIEWDIYRQFPPCVLLNVRFFYNDFGSSPYPVPSHFTKEEVIESVDNWSEDFCRSIYQDYDYCRVYLNWLTSYERRIFLRKAVKELVKNE